MSGLPGKPPESLPYSDSDEELYAWRRDCYRTLGFSETQSGALACKKDLDHHDVSAVVRRGCPVDLAWDIFI